MVETNALQQLTLHLVQHQQPKETVLPQGQREAEHNSKDNNDSDVTQEIQQQNPHPLQCWCYICYSVILKSRDKQCDKKRFCKRGRERVTGVKGAAVLACSP